MKMSRQIIGTFLLLILAIVFFGLSHVDTAIQDNFFNFTTNEWILDKGLQPYKFLFYDGLKKVLILVGLSFVVAFIYSLYTGKFKSYQKGLLIVILSSILVPVVVGTLKKTTNMPCPHSEIRYGGNICKTPVWEQYTPENRPKDHKECWPAGHASGGFALMSLYFLFHSRKNRNRALLFGITVGWIMGVYKMLVGDHFFSHTVITMILAWLIILIIVFFVDKIKYFKRISYV